MSIKGYQTVFVAIYSPTDNTRDEEKDQFYTTLTNLLDNVSKRKEIFLMGDINGSHVGDEAVEQYGETVENDF